MQTFWINIYSFPFYLISPGKLYIYTKTRDLLKNESYKKFL